MTRPEQEIRHWGKLLFERRLISGWGGNLSCRVGKRQFLITGQHAPLGFLKPADIVTINSGGTAVRKTQRPSSETLMHLAVYRGTEAQAIVHVHPPAVLGFSLTHESFTPVSFEEKYTLGEVPILAQETPTVSQPGPVVAALKYSPIVILKGHGTVAIGKDFQEAFLFTDLLEEAVHCQSLIEQVERRDTAERRRPKPGRNENPDPPAGAAYPLFSHGHMTALVESANNDRQFRDYGSETDLSTSLTLLLEDGQISWTVKFLAGKITQLDQQSNGEFLISGKKEWWTAVFNNRIEAFLATQQGKLKLQRGELAQLSRWYKPFQRAFALWQTIPVQ